MAEPVTVDMGGASEINSVNTGESHALAQVVMAGQEVKLARPAGVEPATFGSVDQRSIQLSYGRTAARLLS